MQTILVMKSTSWLIKRKTQSANENNAHQIQSMKTKYLIAYPNGGNGLNGEKPGAQSFSYATQFYRHHFISLCAHLQQSNSSIFGGNRHWPAHKNSYEILICTWRTNEILHISFVAVMSL